MAYDFAKEISNALIDRFLAQQQEEEAKIPLSATAAYLQDKLAEYCNKSDDGDSILSQMGPHYLQNALALSSDVNCILVKLLKETKDPSNPFIVSKRLQLCGFLHDFSTYLGVDDPSPTIKRM
jgi:hypothetical protein